jgi:Pyruvate/2-oxoacid:ferredoxin oxidoreductase gamma subunit
MLGALQAAVPLVSRESLEKALRERFPKFAEVNLKALNAGSELVKSVGSKEGVLIA